MTDPNDQAYPITTTESNGNCGTYEVHHMGLTKREAFAMAAMQGLLAHNMQGIATAATIAGWATEQADALLAELSKDKP